MHKLDVLLSGLGLVLMIALCSIEEARVRQASVISVFPRLIRCIFGKNPFFRALTEG